MGSYFGNGTGNRVADERYALALQLAEWGDYGASADLLQQAVELAPDWPPLHFQLGEVSRQRGKTEESAAAFRAYLALDPEDKLGAAIRLYLLGTTPMPSALPHGYVRALFDQYAPKFEKCLVEILSYHVPEFMFQDVMEFSAGPFARLLDLGCGTGLAARIFTDHAHHKTGIDMAPGMIDIARESGLYDVVHQSDIESFLETNHAPFDLVLAGDVFLYCGALETLFQKIGKAMKDDGLFAFSIKTLATDEDNYLLEEDHSFAHSRAYVERCAHTAGLTMLSCKDVPLRLNDGEFIRGMIFVCRKNAL